MKLIDQLKDYSSEVLRLWSIGIFLPSQMRHQLAVEEMEQKLLAVCAEHYNAAIAWIEWRRDWVGTEPLAWRRAWLDAAADELDHAIRYGPHTEWPHMNKQSELARAEILRRVRGSVAPASDQEGQRP